MWGVQISLLQQWNTYQFLKCLSLRISHCILVWNHSKTPFHFICNDSSGWCCRWVNPWLKPYNPINFILSLDLTYATLLKLLARLPQSRALCLKWSRPKLPPTLAGESVGASMKQHAFYYCDWINCWMNIISILVHFLALWPQTWRSYSLDFVDNQVKNAEKKGQNSKYPQVKKNLH